jgi:hypothetical protein
MTISNLSNQGQKEKQQRPNVSAFFGNVMTGKAKGSSSEQTGSTMMPDPMIRSTIKMIKKINEPLLNMHNSAKKTLVGFDKILVSIADLNRNITMRFRTLNSELTASRTEFLRAVLRAHQENQATNASLGAGATGLGSPDLYKKNNRTPDEKKKQAPNSTFMDMLETALDAFGLGKSIIRGLARFAVSPVGLVLLAGTATFTAFAAAMFGIAKVADMVEDALGLKEKYKARMETQEYKDMQETQSKITEDARNRNIGGGDRIKLMEKTLKDNNLSQKADGLTYDQSKGIITTKDGRRFDINTQKPVETGAPAAAPLAAPASPPGGGVPTPSRGPEYQYPGFKSIRANDPDPVPASPPGGGVGEVAPSAANPLGPQNPSNPAARQERKGEIKADSNRPEISPEEKAKQKAVNEGGGSPTTAAPTPRSRGGNPMRSTIDSIGAPANIGGAAESKPTPGVAPGTPQKIDEKTDGTGGAEIPENDAKTAWDKLNKAEKVALLQMDKRKGGNGKDITSLLSQQNTPEYKEELSRTTKRFEGDKNFGNFGTIPKELIEQSEGRINDYAMAMREKDPDKRKKMMDAYYEQQTTAQQKLSEAISNSEPTEPWSQEAADNAINSMKPKQALKPGEKQETGGAELGNDTSFKPSGPSLAEIRKKTIEDLIGKKTIEDFAKKGAIDPKGDYEVRKKYIESTGELPFDEQGTPTKAGSGKTKISGQFKPRMVAGGDEELNKLEGFKSKEQMGMYQQQLPHPEVEGATIEKGGLEEKQIIDKLTRGERVDPDKPPSTMTKRELANRIRDYGMPALVSGAYSAEEYAKITKQADQPQWKSTAQDKAGEWIKNQSAEAQAKKTMKPLVPPIVMNNSSTTNSSSADGGEGNNVAGQNFPLSATNPHIQEFLKKQNVQYQ